MQENIRSAEERRAVERHAFELIRAYEDPSYFEDYLQQFGPHAEYAPLARRRIEELHRKRFLEAENARSQNRLFGIPLGGFHKVGVLATAISACIALIATVFAFAFPADRSTTSPDVQQPQAAAVTASDEPTDASILPAAMSVTPAPAAPDFQQSTPAVRALYDTGSIPSEPADAFAVAPGEVKKPKPLVVVE